METDNNTYENADKKEKAAKIAALLDEHYPFDKKSFLDYGEPYELLIATILSAQCTDARVNMTTDVLFKKYPSPESFANADFSELARDILPVGLNNSKAKNIIAAMKTLINDYGGVVPSEMDELTKFPGVGRKTANIVRAHVFGIPCVAVDTHVGRLSRLLGLSAHTDPDKVEADLTALLPHDYLIKCNMQMIAHGRAVCKARRPACGECFLKELCDSAKSAAK